MICPVDRQPMLAIEYDGIEIDYCPHCEGIWLDAGELELLLKDDGTEQAPLLSQLQRLKKSKERSYKCPRCALRMQKVFSSNLPSVIFDACPENDGFWFDKGELKAIVSSSNHTAARDVLVNFLQNIFHGPASLKEQNHAD